MDIYDLDNDGSNEIIIEPEDHNTFYVLDHNGNFNWSGPATDNISSISFQDLYRDGTREVIVYSRDTTIPRGQISVFTPAGVLLGSRNFTSADLDGDRSPTSACYEDLDGDGTEEIIPYPIYLNQKMEILSDSCSILDTANLGRDIDSYTTSYDFDGDGNNDIALITCTSSPYTLKIQGFLGFNGSGFNTTWNFPTDGTIEKRGAEWDMDADRIAFGTVDWGIFTGCKVYLLNASDGTEWVASVAVSGSVDDLEYTDLDDDGAKEVAILAGTYSDPTHTWTFYVYDQNLDLLVPGGHFSYQSDTGSKTSSGRFAVATLNGDSMYELIPTYYKYLGSSAHVVDYTGVLKWSYSAPGPITDLDYFYDIDGDGNDDLGVISSTGGSGHIALLKDNGVSYGTIGARSFADEVDSVSYRSFDDHSGREVMPYFETSLDRSLYSYDLSHCFWSFTASGDEIVSISDTDIDENDVDDIYMASNDTTTPTGYAYVFFGSALPKNPVLSSGDYDGDGTSNIAVFRGETGLWAVRGVTRAYFGGSSDIPVSGDYNGNGTSDIGIYRGSSGLWAIRGVTRSYFGSASDTVVPGDYNGDGCCDTGIFRESSGLWAIRGITRVYFGTTADAPVPADYNGNGTSDFGIYRGSSGLWALRGMSRVYFGSVLDAPVPGDYNANESDGIAIFRPSSGLWAIREVTRTYFGNSSDQPVPADYNGNNADDIGIFRSSSGLWAIRGITRAYYGSSDYLPVTR
ncbi:MAG: VCBS repeat-containing protein [Candidatus Euphemobacter frigidus]|nr:VCBS repeat-containing protein [Candidatus Euphemobacter frigidus]MDP8276049.1 VCBS repeat-containing protein [Candidatus Euphemobacter frigidus]